MKKSTLFPLFLKTGWQGALKKIPIILLLLVGANVFAQTNVAVIPATSVIENGQSVTVTLRVQVLAGQVGGAEVHLDFDNTYLQVTAASAHPDGANFDIVGQALGPIATMNTNGHVHYAAAASTTNATDTFDFVSITFQAIAIPPGNTTPLTFTTVAPHITDVQDENTLSVLDTIKNGTIAINAVGCTVPTATISTPGGLTTCSFNLTLSAATGGTDYDLVINGTTFPNVPAGGTITAFTVPEERIFGLADPATIPPSFNDNPPPNEGIEFGVRFTSSQDGFIKGVRFWSPNPVFLAGDYTGSLWTAGGANLGTVLFDSASVIANEWVEVYFPTAIAVTAGATYVASVFSDSASYTATVGGFAADTTVGSLTVPLAGNGVYAYNVATSTFPASTNGNGSNYWVDVIFSAETNTFALTAVTANTGCINIGAPLQTLAVTTVDCSTLPVSLVGLSATPNGKDIVLSWSTASEFNNLGFEVQRQTDGSDWTAIGFVNGAGNSTSLEKYSYVDKNLASRRYYYRLKQIDIDRLFVYSPIVSAIINGSESFTLEQNYPNPFRNLTSVRFTLPRASKVNLSVFDMHGRLVKVLVNESRNSGTHVVNFNSATFRSGVYFYKLQAGEHSEVKKMTIQ